MTKDRKAEALVEVCALPDDAQRTLRALDSRQRELARSSPGEVWEVEGRSLAPFVTGTGMEHPSENGFSFLSPYGLPYLPASSVKGVLRDAAESLSQEDHQEWSRPGVVEALFGRPESKDPRERQEAPGWGGALRFWDVLPQPPETGTASLSVEVMTPHHSAYYQQKPPGAPPVDSEDPTPIPYLAIPAGWRFPFRVGFDAVLEERVEASREDRSSILRALSVTWPALLDAAFARAFAWVGFGAKTRAGHGRLRRVSGRTLPRAEEAPPAWLNSKRRAIAWKEEVRLVSPAFLAGARQEAGDCDLSVGTLRGHLRWWWRTRHAAYLDPGELHALETRVWGMADVASPVHLTVERLEGGDVRPFTDIKDGFRFQREFLQAVPLPRAERGRTPGILYLAYGMAERNRGELRVRHYQPAPARWELGFMAAEVPGSRSASCIPAERIEAEVRDSLALLCHWGGVGSRSRKGFGSLARLDAADFDLDGIIRRAAELREHLGVDRRSRRDQVADYPALEEGIEWPVDLPDRSVWRALEDLGASFQLFASDNKHDPRKAALGLPRKIHGPKREPMNHQGRAHQPPEPLERSLNVRRWASPVHFHLDEKGAGFLLRAIAFPTRSLPDAETSRSVLRELRQHMLDDLPTQARRHAGDGGGGGGRGGGSRRGPGGGRGGQREHRGQRPSTPKLSAKLEKGQQIEVELTKANKNGRWQAVHAATGARVSIQGSENLQDAARGKVVRVRVTIPSASPHHCSQSDLVED